MIDYKFKKTEQECTQIQALAETCNIYFETASILFNRGIDTKEKIEAFLSPSKNRFIDPYKLKGMAEAVERIKQAKEGGETVLVYGDYDADGISASAIMHYALREFGIEAITVVPERENGYGLRQELIDSLIEEYLCDLIITVDCGISCYNEVEYLKDLGVDVIVTDHHELPERLPECTVVNCKIQSDYGFESLCGAGVAYKLATALIGKKADEYLDFVAIATIADSMPLIGENRDIVYEGINYIKSGKAHKCINELIAVSNLKEVSSSGLAFTIAPRINAAGRMGDAASALRLMTTDNPDEIESLAVKLNAYNIERQSDCERLYTLARKKLITEAYDKKIAVLQDESWNGGLVGIIAAKLVEEFSRPVILFVNKDGKLHGSARSIDNVNIYEAIFDCRDLLTDFGGHAQAAGVSIDIENYQTFVDRIINYIDKKYDYSYFKPYKMVEFEIDKPFSIQLAKELNRLEPFGTGNRRPCFSVKTSDSFAELIKPSSPHVIIKTDCIDMLYFNGSPLLEQLNSASEKEIVFEPNISIFNHTESLKGYVKDIDYIVDTNEKNSLYCFRGSLLTALNENDDFIYVSSEMTKKVISEKIIENYGTIFAVYNPINLNIDKRLDNLDRFMYSTRNKNLINNIVFALKSNEIKGYRQIVYLDRPLGAVPEISGITDTFIDRNLWAYDYTKLSTEKQTFAEIFRWCKDNPNNGGDSVLYALNSDFGYSKEQVIFVLEVFVELGIFTFKNRRLQYNSDIRSSLNSSKIYSEVEKLK